MRADSFAAWVMPNGQWSANSVAAFERTARSNGLSARPSQTGVLIANAGDAFAAGPDAVLFGQAFRSGTTDRIAQAGLQCTSGSPSAFMRAHWGNYVAISPEPAGAGAVILRAPFGDLPCFWSTESPHLVVASSMTLLEAFCVAQPAIDWEEVARFLLATELRSERTCLSGVSELQGGSALHFGRDGIRTEQVWSPWAFACSAGAQPSLEEASATVGAAIDLAVAGRTADSRRSVLLLSGGIDSSTVAASLRANGRRFFSLNMVAKERTGDERTFARAVAEAVASPLTECSRVAQGIVWDDGTPRKLARPSARAFRQPTLAAAQAVAKEHGAEIIVDGAGGDNVFCSLQSVAPVLDRWAIEGLGRGVWDTARDIALQVDVSLGTVMRKAVLRRINGRVRYRWPIETSLLARSVAEKAAEGARHPWLAAPPGSLPGQAAHVALVLGALPLAENHATVDTVRTVAPLVSQPVVEAVLRVPSWLWFDHGRNRAVARRAMRDRVPASVLARYGKGRTSGFMAEVVQVHRRRLRELLCDGLLVCQGIVDHGEVDSYLSCEVPVRDLRFARILQLADAERWARSWS